MQTKAVSSGTRSKLPAGAEEDAGDSDVGIELAERGGYLNNVQSERVSKSVGAGT